MACSLIANLDTVRVTKLDACGVPLVGPNAFVTECVASVAMNPNIDTQDDKVYRAANGSLCGFKPGCPTLLNYNLEFNFFQVSPQLADVLTGSPVVLDAGGEPVGFDSCNINCTGGFALEFWAELLNQDCAETGTPQYLYVLIPWVSNAYLTDLEIGSDAVTFQVLGSSRAGGGWGVGPYDVVDTAIPPATPAVPGPMLTPLGATCHRRIMTTTIAPPVPDPDCDYATVPALVP